MEAPSTELQAGGIQECIDAMRDFAPRIPDNDRVNNVISYLDNIRATLDGSAAMTEKQTATRHIKQALMLTYLKSTYASQEIIQRILDKTLPGTGLHAKTLASFTKSKHDQFRIDLAYLHIQRDLNFQRCMVKFAWTDSSPQEDSITCFGSSGRFQQSKSSMPPSSWSSW